MVAHYNDSPDAAVAASQSLMERASELLGESAQDPDHVLNLIWNNVGFHVANVRLADLGHNMPVGVDAQMYIALVLAASENAAVQRLLDYPEQPCDEGSSST